MLSVLLIFMFVSGSCDPASCSCSCSCCCWNDCECDCDCEGECEVEDDDDSPMLSFDSRSIEVVELELELEADMERGSCLQSLLDGLRFARRCSEGLNWGKCRNGDGDFFGCFGHFPFCWEEEEEDCNRDCDCLLLWWLKKSLLFELGSWT